STCCLLCFLNDTLTPEIYTLSTRRSSDLSGEWPIRYQGQQANHTERSERPVPHRTHDRRDGSLWLGQVDYARVHCRLPKERPLGDRKSTRLNSSHVKISYAVFCLKKKTIQ